MPDVEKDGLDTKDEGSSKVTVNVDNNNSNDNDSSDNSDTSDNQKSRSTSFEFQTRDVPLAEKEKWFKTYWRPAAAWIYLGINIFDFVIAPVIAMLLPKFMAITYSPWQSLTLSNGGLFHLAFGAIIGVTSWGRTKERLNGVGPTDNG